MQSKQHNEQIFTSILAKLNPEQRQAVETTYGPVLVLAGPGTGKTQVLSARIGQLLSNTDLQVNPSNILCLTFTDAGTIAMRNRLLRFMGPMAYKVSIHTFHSFCNEVIMYNRHYFSKGELQPVSELETMQYYQELYRSIPTDSIIREFKEESEKYGIRSLKSLFDTMKKEHLTYEIINHAANDYIKGLPLDEKYIYKINTKNFKKGDLKKAEIQKEEQRMAKLVEAARHFQSYQDLLVEKGRYDFNDMILWVLDAFRKYKDLLYSYQERFQYILVDEFQDTSNAQNEILNLLCSYDDAPNIFVVGDDDQSIYRFQGASMKNIVTYVEQYNADLTRIVMKDNYRSTQKILDASKSLIDYNKERLINRFVDLDKNLIARLDEVKDIPDLPMVSEFRNVFHEEASIIDLIEKQFNLTNDLSNIAVIYRSHKTVDRMVNILEQKNIPVNLKKSINVLEVSFIKQLISILSYVLKETEYPYSGKVELFKILHYSIFDISSLDIAKMVMIAKEQELDLRTVIADRKLLQRSEINDIDQVIKFSRLSEDWIKQYHSNTPQVLFEIILKQSGFLDALLIGENHNWNIQVLSTFFDLMKSDSEKQRNYTLENFFATLDGMNRYELDLPLEKTTVNSKGVNFLTSHSSKGLEFDTVYIVGATQSNWEKKRARVESYKFPPTLVTNGEEHESIEEERRLFYVAMTRAVKNLKISYAISNEDGKQVQASQFVSEIMPFVTFHSVKEGYEDEIALYRLMSNINERKVRLEVIDSERIRQQLENYTLSVTHVNKYLNCPISFYFENILKVPSARTEHSGFGSAVHLALQYYYQEMKSNQDNNIPTKEFLLSSFEKAMDHYKSHFTKQQFINRLEYGKIILGENYDQNHEVWNRNTKNIEIEFHLKDIEIEGIPVNGMIDRLDKNDGNKVRVIDYKTGKPERGSAKIKGPNEKDPNGGDYWRQMVFYKLLLDNYIRENLHYEEGVFDFLEPEKDTNEFKSYKVLVTPQDELIVKGQIKEVYRNILDLKFDVGCGDKDCQWCSFVKENYKEGELSLLNTEEL